MHPAVNGFCKQLSGCRNGSLGYLAVSIPCARLRAADDHSDLEAIQDQGLCKLQKSFMSAAGMMAEKGSGTTALCKIPSRQICYNTGQTGSLRKQLLPLLKLGDIQ